MIKRLALVTTRAARGRDEDEPKVVAALENSGCAVEVVDWDKQDFDWSQFDRVVLRSTWDYPSRIVEFLAWLDHLAPITEVVNSPATIRWNLDKNYLSELAGVGIAIPNTTFVQPNSVATFPSGEFVIKPAVGAGSRDASSYAADQHEIAFGHVSRLHAAGLTVIVQPLLKSVARDGELVFVFFDGKFSHAANKRIALPWASSVEDLFATESNSPHSATTAELKVASAAINLVSIRFGTPSYARVDLVRDDQDNYCVLELELIEPSLFLNYADDAAVERFVQALIR